MDPLARPRIVAVFVAPEWIDQARLRTWAKLVGDSRTSTGERIISMVLLTDDMTDGNSTLSRQFRCSDVVNAVVRVAGMLRSHQSLAAARADRDLVMAQVADVVVDFGHIEGGCDRFPGRRTTVLA